MRGQAHVAFHDLASATNAMRALQGTRFCGKSMRIQYAKTQSNALKDGPGASKSVEAVILANSAAADAPLLAGVEVTQHQQQQANTAAGEKCKHHVKPDSTIKTQPIHV
jgi:RNA recognition motif-containing protein